MVAALLDAGSDGEWAEALIAEGGLVAPHVLPVEVAGTLRRGVSAGAIDPALGSLAHADLLGLRLDLVPYAAVGPRAWELRGSVTPFDACYVAVAESLGVPLATLDRRLVRAPGPRCDFLVPEG